MNWLFFSLGLLIGIIVTAAIFYRLMYAPLKQKALKQSQETEAAKTETIVAKKEQELALAQQQETEQKLEEVSRQREQLLQQNARHETLLKESVELKQQMQETFENLSQKILNHRLNELEENTDKQRVQDIKSIDALLKPLSELVQRNDKENQSLKTELNRFINLNSQWVDALKESKGRGDWGELELYRLLEESGVHFEKQVSDNGLRPDVKVPLTNGRFIYIDAKTILTNLARAQEQNDEHLAEEERNKHVKALEHEIKKLSIKSYETLSKGSIDFVVLFVPRESMLRVALETSPSIMEDAFNKNIILASPLILMAVLKTVAYEWQQVRLSKDAETIKTIGQELHKRAEIFIRKFDKVGTQLLTVQNSYIETQRSLSGRFIPQLKKFETMGCSSKNPLPEELVDVEIAIPKLTGIAGE